MSVEPWSKWFWTDYEADPGLRMSSLAAQGLWMRMLCLMAKASPKGELRVGSEPCTMADLAVYVGQPEETVATLVGELERRGVFSRTRAGVIYNRRLRKDAKISRIRAEAGSKGAAATNRRTNDKSDLPQQNGGKDTGKPHGKSPAPEARSQKPEARSHNPEPLNRARQPAMPADVRAVMEAGGFVAPPPDLPMLRQWYDAGAELEQDIVPVMRRETAQYTGRTGKAPRSLKFFDTAIREKLAEEQKRGEYYDKVIRTYGGTPQ